MKKKDFFHLPKEAQDFIWNNFDNINDDLESRYNLNYEQIEFISALEDRVVLKETASLDVPKELERIPEGKNLDKRKIALDLALKAFAPLRGHLEGVDRLILRLGGKIPKHKNLRISNTVQKDKFFNNETNTIKGLIKKYDNFKNLRLTSKKITNKQGRIIASTVENWIKDYVGFVGAGAHNSLQRSKYLSKSPNVLSLSQSEQDSLRYFLTSYDEGAEVEASLSGGILKFSQAHQETKEPKERLSLDGSVKNLHKNLVELDKKLLPVDFLLSESGHQPEKVRDILWQAIGMQDKEKAISCLRLLIKNRSFEAMLQEDNRYKNILKRFVNIRYGRAVENWMDNNIDKLLRARLFMEMTLIDKLHMANQDARTAAFYLTNLFPNSGQVVHLNEANSNLEWRELHLLGDSKLAWVDSI